MPFDFAAAILYFDWGLAGIKLLTHSSGGVADCLDRACKLFLCYAKMPRPNPDLIFTVDDDLAAVAG
jgi:hypothetical protein